MMKKEYRPVFSTITPCSARYLVTMAAGMPKSSAKSPSTSSPGVMTVALIGSSMLKPGADCRSRASVRPGLSIQSSRSPIPSSARSSGPQTLNHQSTPNSSSTLRMARRKSSASRIDSSTSAVPPGGFHHRRRHIAGGDDGVLRAGRGMHQVGFVEDVAVELAVLGILHQDLRGLDRPASSLWVDCVAKIIDSLQRGRSAPMACIVADRNRGRWRAAARLRRNAGCRSCRPASSLMSSTL